MAPLYRCLPARTVLIPAVLSLVLAGCGIAPKKFRRVDDPSPIVRARSVSLGGGMPEGKVVPALIDRLEDKDAVVRLAASEELRKGTGKTFGFIPWGSESERTRSVSRWRKWWLGRQESSPPTAPSAKP